MRLWSVNNRIFLKTKRMIIYDWAETRKSLLLTDLDVIRLTSTMSTATGPATTRLTVEVNAVRGSNANDKLRRRQRQRQRLRGLRQPGRYRGQRTSTLYV